MLFNNQAAPTWDEPIDMLFACHGKVQKFCAQLLLLPDYVAEHGVNDTVRQAVAQIQIYFNQAAPLHHEDEELDFFPALLRHAPQAQADIEILQNQHHGLHDNWAQVCSQLNALLSGSLKQLDDALLQRFTQAYAVHIAIEEPLFELGRQHIPESERHAMGQIMAARRGAGRV